MFIGLNNTAVTIQLADFKGEKGDQGERGPKGARGEKGVPGKSIFISPPPITPPPPNSPGYKGKVTIVVLGPKCARCHLSDAVHTLIQILQ